MTYQEAIVLVTATIAPQSLSELQINVLRGAGNKQSYHQISLELNHEYSYIKDVGTQLWQMLTQELYQFHKIVLQWVKVHFRIY